MNNRLRQRRLDRHNAASIRALSGAPDTEFSAGRLQLARENVVYYAPHLQIDTQENNLQRCRGVADAIALRIRLSNSSTYRETCPLESFPSLLFDMLEQLRVESIVPKSLPGLRRNLKTAFSAWSDECRSNGFTENNIGILIYTTAHMCRMRLTGEPESEEVESLIEDTRAGISPVIGHELAKLRSTKTEQSAYATQASILAEKLASLLEDSGSRQQTDDKAVAEQLRLVLPPVAEHEGSLQEGSFAIGLSHDKNSGFVDALNSYSVYSKEYDQVVKAEKLYPTVVRNRLRGELDQLVAAQTVSVSRLALRLRYLLSEPEPKSLSFGEDSGFLDPRRLTQLVCNPSHQDVFYSTKNSLHSDSVVSFLVDNSGSMKKYRFATVAVYVDILSRALDLAGVTNEVLGFTTGGWSGGRVLRDWRKAGSPENPGRLNEVQHIQYKLADESWRRQRRSLSVMLNTHHFREGVDGEALTWAWQRLQKRPEKRKILLLISDGLPMDSATAQSNDEHYLHQHLKAVSGWIEKEGSVELAAIGVGDDLSGFFLNSCQLDMQGALSNSSFRVLEELFSSFGK